MPRKIKYKAIYHNPQQNPFKPVLTVPTRTVEIDANVPIEQVEKWAKEVEEPYRFVRVEVVPDRYYHGESS